MKNYEFKLTPAYCLYNGIAVMQQKGADICFITEDPQNALLRERITKAFNNFITYVVKQADCPADFMEKPRVRFVAGNRGELRKYVSKLYEGKGSFNNPAETAAEEEVAAEEARSAQKTGQADAAAVLLLDSLMAEARNKKATDIHIEKDTVRFRIYGRLELVSRLSAEKSRELIQRIKFLAGMNVLENRRSQDGHFVYGNKEPVFVRVSTIGIIGDSQNKGEESLVLRLLDTSRLPLRMDKLGFSKNQLVKIKELGQNKNGLVIISGPTGSGKSTTAASMLVNISTEKENSVKIISLEDPPEYLIPGVTQIRIDEKVNNSFSNALIHVFRQDPDVLMIGEIRDEKSAAVAIRAALTGHLVIATLHTASAAGSILRLENLGIPRKLILSVLKGLIVQSLYTFKEKITLLADVALPLEELKNNSSAEMTEDRLEKLFEHNTNYSQVIDTAIGVLKEKHSLETEAAVTRESAQTREPAAGKEYPVTKKLPAKKSRKNPLIISKKVNKNKGEAV